MAIINLKKYSNKRLMITTPKGYAPSVFIVPEDALASITVMQDDHFALAAYFSSGKGEKVCFGVTWAKAASLLLSEFESSEEAEKLGIEMVDSEEFNLLAEEFDDFITHELTNSGEAFDFKKEESLKIAKKSNIFA